MKTSQLTQLSHIKSLKKKTDSILPLPESFPVQEGIPHSSHKREILYDTIFAQDTLLWIRGQLIDWHVIENQSEIQPFVVHHMIVRLAVEPIDLTIKQADFSMPKPAFEQYCHPVEKLAQRLVDVRIDKGFQKKLSELFPIEDRCVHITSILSVIGTALFQARAFVCFFPQFQHLQGEALREALAMTVEGAKSSCHVWDERSPAYIKMKKGDASELFDQVTHKDTKPESEDL